MPFRLKMFVREEDGAGLIEYGLVLALVTLVLLPAASYLSAGIWTLFASIGNDLSTTEPGGGPPGGTPPGHGGTPPGQGGTPPGRGP